MISTQVEQADLGVEVGVWYSDFYTYSYEKYKVFIRLLHVHFLIYRRNFLWALISNWCQKAWKVSLELDHWFQSYSNSKLAQIVISKDFARLNYICTLINHTLYIGSTGNLLHKYSSPSTHKHICQSSEPRYSRY